MSKSIMSLMFGPKADVDSAVRLVQSASSIHDFEELDVQNALVGCAHADKFAPLLLAIVQLDVDNHFSETSLMSAVESNNVELVRRLLPVVSLIESDHVTGCLDAVDPDEDDNDHPDASRACDDQVQILKLLLKKHQISDEDLLDAMEIAYHRQRSDLFASLYRHVTHCLPELQRFSQLYRHGPWDDMVDHAQYVITREVLEETVEPVLEHLPCAKPKKM